REQTTSATYVPRTSWRRWSNCDARRIAAVTFAHSRTSLTTWVPRSASRGTSSASTARTHRGAGLRRSTRRSLYRQPGKAPTAPRHVHTRDRASADRRAHRGVRRGVPAYPGGAPGVWLADL